MRVYSEIGFQVPDILIPDKSVVKEKWAVIACDQYTSQPEYWMQVKKITENLPSTYHLILPEAYLGKPEELIHTSKINSTMTAYLKTGIFQSIEGLVLVERTLGSKKRQGLIAALDLEQYDFDINSQSLIRATEGTILNRLPPRIKIRENAPLEIPHIMALIDDPLFAVIEPLSKHTNDFPILYDFNLMLGGGHLKGYLVDNKEVEKRIINSLMNLAKLDIQKQKYQYDSKPLIFAVGDGNHSLATAKSIWRTIKDKVGLDHPARYALVEIVNIHSDGIEFTPIHRLLKHFNSDICQDISKFFLEKVALRKTNDFVSLMEKVNDQRTGTQIIGLLFNNDFYIMEITKPLSILAVGSLQSYLDNLEVRHPEIEIDFIHGDQTLQQLCSHSGNIGFFLPALEKSSLFKSIIKDGPLPRKTFSMGEAQEKRYYFESRKIQLIN